MGQTEEYIEINLKAMLFQVLYHWRQVLAAALVLGVVLGGFQSIRSALVPPEETGDWSDYESYQRKLSLAQERIASAQDRIDTLQMYMDNAVMMKADYRNVYIAKATYYVDSGYQILPENTYQDTDKTPALTWYYQNYLQDYSLYEELSAQVGLEPKYLMDLVWVERVNGNTLMISVSHPYERSAKQIMAAIQDTLDGIQTQLEQTIGEHSLTLMLDTCGVYVDEELKSRQQKVNDDMLKYQQELIDAQQSLDALLEAGEPEQSDEGKSFLKWAILGAVCGGMLTAVWYAGLAAFGSRVYTPEDVTFGGSLPLLGILSREREYDLITALLRKLEGCLTENSPANDLLLAANLNLDSSGGEKFLLYSDAGPESSAFAAERLRTLVPQPLIPLGSLSSDTAALEALMGEGSAVLVVTAGASRKKEVKKALQLLQARKKHIAGILFLE